jgi:DsbC/DsbD-like thiol-disulfide interchange protein
MYKGELFNYRYGEILAAIEATPGVSNMELTAAMKKEGDITGRVERSGLHSKTLWFANDNKKYLQEPEGRVSTATAPQATYPVRVRVVEEEAQPATYPVRVRVAEEYFLPTK